MKKKLHGVLGNETRGRRHLPGLVPAALACAVGTVVAATPAAAHRPATVTVSHPPGYQVVHSTPFSAPPSAFDSGGSAACPTGTVVWGGGVAFIGGSEPALTVNTSEPAGNSWAARVNNTGTTTRQFRVDVICAKKPMGYQLVFKNVDNPANSQSHATVTCPSPKVVLGGGTLSTSDQAPAVLNSAWPSASNKFTAYMDNGTTTDARLDVFALCGHKPAGYKIVSNGAAVDPGFTLDDGIGCPTGTAALSGGARTIGHSPAVQVGGSIDQGAFGWAIDVNNTTASVQQVNGYVICAA